MKTTKITAVLAALGFASASAIAAPATSLQNDAFWQGIIQHNQDNVGVQILQTGQHTIGGLFRTQLVNRSKRTSYDNDSQNNKGNTSFGLRSSELYFDAQPAQYAKVHFVMDYDDNFTNLNSTDATTAAPNAELFFPEANVTLSHGNLWATVGREFSNFGSVKRFSTAIPLTEVLTTSAQTGIDLGYAMRKIGLYGDVFVYNGAQYGKTSTQLANAANNIHGYSAELGYAANNGANTWYGHDYVNVALSYINDINDTITMRGYLNSLATESAPEQTPTLNKPEKQTPAYAVHADYTRGAFAVLADYVMVDRLEGTDLKYGTANSLKAAAPSAYTLQTSYAFTTAGSHNNYITLGIDGSEQALGITPYGGSFSMPKQRLLVNYKYDLMKNVSAEVEYDMDQDYATSAESAYPGTPNKQGTGQSNNVITARLNVIF